MRLVVSNVFHQYPRTATPVLTDASIVVETGEVVGIIGPSGSGKTTLLAIMGGLLRPTKGSVTLADHSASTDVVPTPAWILQTANFLPDRSTADNVALGGLSAGLNWREAQSFAKELLKSFGLTDKAGEPIRVLSGGEVQRAIIARALASRRPFILADEPTGHLDRSTSDAIIEVLLQGKHDQGLVVATHDVRVAERSDVVYELIDGRLVAQS